MGKTEKNIKILVTGGAGFIGSHLTDRLLDSGYFVRVIDNLINGKMENLKYAGKSWKFEFIKGDILNKVDCDAVCKDIDIVFHLACLGVRHSIHSPFENHRVNAEGTLNLLEASLKYKIKKFFYISTSEVYGKTDKFPITEESLTLPITVYGASKLAGENYTKAYFECYGLNATILRIFNNYGPRAHYEGDAGEIIPRSIVNVLYDKKPTIFGDGKITRDFFYVKDTARVLSDLINVENTEGKIFNIGTGVEITMKYLIESILILMGKDKGFIDFYKSRPADVPRLWVNPSKFTELTNFKSSYDFDSGLIETIEYYKELKKGRELITEIALENWNK